MNDEELEQDIRDNLSNDLEEDLMELVAALQNIATKTTCSTDRYYLMESAVTMEHLFHILFHIGPHGDAR